MDIDERLTAIIRKLNTSVLGIIEQIRLADELAKIRDEIREQGARG